MTTISDSTYSNIYSYANIKLSDQLDTNASTYKDKETNSTTKTEDTVTLSSEITTAQKREYLGLTPIGRLSLTDFQDAATDQEDTVSTMLADAMKELEIDADQKISLSLDDDNQIVIREDFSGKSELENVLSEDKTFMKAFRGMSANNEVLDYIYSLQTNTMSLLGYMTSNTNSGDLLSLAADYTIAKSSGHSIETLLSLSQSEAPYTYVYNAIN